MTIIFTSANREYRVIFNSHRDYAEGARARGPISLIHLSHSSTVKFSFLKHYYNKINNLSLFQNKIMNKINIINEISFSSLLVVYEGYQIDDYPNRSRSPLTTLGVEEESNESSSFIDNLAHDSDSYCDGSQSNTSTDYNIGNEEVSQSTLHRAFGEAAARGAKHATGFYPINEETVFMDSPSDLMNATVVPSQAYDNWIGSTFGGTESNSNSGNVSGSSSSSNSSSSDDEYCCVGQHTITNSDDISSDLDIGGKCSLKRTRPRHRLRLYEGDELTHHRKEDIKCATKRLRVKNDKKVDLPEDTMVDVRMIDFAHTTFGHNIASSSVGACHSSSTVHQGPDCGFLTGLDSLKRLLMEILAEG